MTTANYLTLLAINHFLAWVDFFALSHNVPFCMLQSMAVGSNLKEQIEIDGPQALALKQSNCLQLPDTKPALLSEIGLRLGWTFFQEIPLTCITSPNNQPQHSMQKQDLTLAGSLKLFHPLNVQVVHSRVTDRFLGVSERSCDINHGVTSNCQLQIPWLIWLKTHRLGLVQF